MKEPTIEITYNGMKYYSEVALAENQLKWYNLGKAVGIEEGKKEATLEKVDQFNKGYEIGKYEGLEKGKREQYTNNIKLIHESNEKSRKLGYDEGYEAGTCKLNILTEQAYNEGYEAGKSETYDKGYTTGFDDGLDSATIANTTAVKPTPCNHGECIAGKEEEYEKGYYEGYNDGYEESRVVTKILSKFDK